MLCCLVVRQIFILSVTLSVPRMSQSLAPLPPLPPLPGQAGLGPPSAAEEETCPVCCEALQLTAAGACSHRVCHRCALRLRVLCQDSSCPVCRAALDRV